METRSIQQQRPVAFSHVQKAAPQFGHAQQPARPSVRFSGSDDEAPGGLKKLWIAFKAKLNFFGNKALSANAIEVLQKEIESLGQQSAAAKKTKNEIVGNANQAQERLEKLKQEKTALETEAFSKLDLLDKVQARDAETLQRLQLADEKQVQEFLKVANAETERVAKELNQKTADIETQSDRVEQLTKQAEAAEARERQIQQQLKNYAQQLQTDQARIKDTKLNNKVAEMNNKLQQLTGVTVTGSDAVSQLRERINTDYHTSRAALNDGGTADEVIARAKFEQQVQGAAAQDTLAALRAKRDAAKQADAQQQAGSASNAASEATE